MKYVAKTRDAAGTSASKKYREDGLVPGVVYASDMEPINIVLDKMDVEEIERELGSNSVFQLEIEGEETRTVFLRDISRAALKPIIYNVALQAIKAGEKLEVTLPIWIENEDKLADKEGIASLNIFEIEARMEPAKAPEAIIADGAGMEIGDTISVADITFEGIEDAEILTDMDDVLVSITLPDEEPEEEEAVDEEVEPEVIGAEDTEVEEADDKE